MGVIKDMPFTFKFWTGIMTINIIIFAFFTFLSEKIKYFVFIFLSIMLGSLLYSFVGLPYVRFSTFDKTFYFYSMRSYDYIKLDNNFLVFDYAENDKDKIRFINYINNRYSMNGALYNYLNKIDDQNLSIKIYDIKNKRFIIIQSLDGSELEIVDSQNNTFIMNNDETKFKYYASAVDKEKDYIIKINDEEYRIDLSKTEDEYLKDRLNKYNN